MCVIVLITGLRKLKAVACERMPCGSPQIPSPSLFVYETPHKISVIIPCHTSWHTHTQPSQVWIKLAVYQSISQICSDQIPLSEKVIFFRLLPDVYLKALFSFLSSFSRNSVRVWCILVNIPSNEDTLRQTHPEMLHVCCSLPQGR